MFFIGQTLNHFYVTYSFCELLIFFYSPVPNNRGEGPADNLTIKKSGEGGLKNVLGQKWQPVITNYWCSKQLLIVEKHQYNFSCSIHLNIKQNNVSNNLANLINVNTKSFLRNQTHLCIHLLALLVPSH